MGMVQSRLSTLELCNEFYSCMFRSHFLATLYTSHLSEQSSVSGWDTVIR